MYNTKYDSYYTVVVLTYTVGNVVHCIQIRKTQQKISYKYRKHFEQYHMTNQIQCKILYKVSGDLLKI